MSACRACSARKSAAWSWLTWSVASSAGSEHAASSESDTAVAASAPASRARRFFGLVITGPPRQASSTASRSAMRRESRPGRPARRPRPPPGGSGSAGRAAAPRSRSSVRPWSSLPRIRPLGHVALRVESRHRRPVHHDRAVGAQAGDDRVGEPLLLLGELDPLAGERVDRLRQHDVALEADPGALGDRGAAAVAVGRGRRLHEHVRRRAGQADRERVVELAGLELAGTDQPGEQRQAGAAGALASTAG